MPAEQLAVLGSPIAHSRSPLLHRTAYRALGLPWTYGAREVTADALPAFLASLDGTWRGLSLTMPLKEAVRPLLDSEDEIARLSGSVNTVLVQHVDGRRRLLGYNTDVAGIREAVRRARTAPVGEVLVIGGGATARSAVVAAAGLGAEHVDIVLRSPEKAAPVVEAARSSSLRARVFALDDPAVPTLAPDLTISTLPGATGVERTFAASAAVGSSDLLDVAYHPWPSPLAELWRSGGRTTISGLAMLVHQAVAQIRIFAGGDPLVPLKNEAAVTDAMLQAVANP